MASGKQSKRRRREAQIRTPPAPSGDRSRQASPRVLLAVGILVLLAGAGIGLGIAFSGGSSSSTTVPARGSLAGALPGAASVQQLFRGIAQHANVLGLPAAPVTMIEYVDLQCPYCRQFEVLVLPGLVSRYVRTGKLRIEARTIAFIGPDSERGRAAAIAAGQQGRMFNFMELLYFNQGTENTGWLGGTMVESAAAGISGLAVPRFLNALDSRVVANEEKTFDAEARADGVNSTPTILVGKSSRKLREVALASPADEHTVAVAIENALR